MTDLSTIYSQYIEQALRELGDSVEKLLAPTRPNTPIPRPRVFRIGSSFRWPYIWGNGKPEWILMSSGEYCYSIDPRFRTKSYPERQTSYLIRALLSDCEYQPSRVLRAATQIRVAAEWCRKRAEGRRRHAKEILLQQRRAVEKIQTDLALGVLAQDSK